MDTALVVSLVKERLGIKTAVRDTYLTAVVQGVLSEMEDEKGLVLDGNNPNHLMFVVDYATWRYQSRDSEGSLPRHLQYRLHNMMFHVGAMSLTVKAIESVAMLPDAPEENKVYILSVDGSKHMYLDGTWVHVELTEGNWVVVV